MGKLIKTTAWITGAGGGIVTLVLQVPPAQATSNAALWVQAISGHLPNWPHQVDNWLMIPAVLAMLAPLAWWTWSKRKALKGDLPIVVLPKDKPALTSNLSSEFDSAFDEITSEKIPYSRVRQIALDQGVSLARFGADQNNGYDLEGALRQAAVDDELNVWGRMYRGPARHNDPLVLIPASHFSEYGFNHGAIDHAPSDNADTHTETLNMLTFGQKGIPNVTFYDIHLSTSDVQRIVSDFKKRSIPS